MDGIRYSDYTADRWPWPRKRSPSAELSSIFTDQASLKTAVGKKRNSDGQGKAEHHEPAHAVKSTAAKGL